MSGTATNQVPESARAHLDIRFTPQHDRKKLVRNIRMLAKTHPRISVRELTSGSAHRVDTKAEAITLWSDFVKERCGIKTSFIASHGSSDARFFGGKKTVTLLTRPDSGGLHTEHEWIGRESLARFYDVFEAWVQEVARRKR